MGLADPDYFWHAKTGEVIASTGALPFYDPFSYTAANSALTHQAWLSQVLIYFIHEYFGDYALIIFVALVAGAAWYWSFRSARIFLPSPAASLACALLFAPGMILFLTPRPQLISFFLFALVLHQLLRSKYSHSWRPLLVLPFVMAAWVNMHGAFIMGLALLLAFVLAEGASAFGEGREDYRSRFLWFALALLACVAASLLNPAGPRMLLFPFHMVSLDSAHWILEWQALDLTQPFGIMALGSGVLFFSLNAYRRRAPDLLELGLPISLFLAGFTSLRYYPYTAMTLIPFLAQAIAEGAFAELFQGPLRFMARPMAGLNALWAWLVRRFAPLQDHPRGYLVHWLAVAVVLFVLTPVQLLYAWSPAQRDAKLPVQAVDFVEANDIQGRMLNSYNIGGYLLFRLHPDRQVFVDPRADLYGDDFLRRYLTLVGAKEGWREILADWKIDYAVLLSSEPLRAALVRDGSFAEVYSDDKFVVLVRRAPQFEQLIQASGSTRKGAATAVAPVD